MCLYTYITTTIITKRVHELVGRGHRRGHREERDGERDITVFIIIFNQNTMFWENFKRYNRTIYFRINPKNVLRKLLYKHIGKEGKSQVGMVIHT